MQSAEQERLKPKPKAPAADAGKAQQAPLQMQEYKVGDGFFQSEFGKVLGGFFWKISEGFDDFLEGLGGFWRVSMIFRRVWRIIGGSWRVCIGGRRCW